MNIQDFIQPICCRSAWSQLLVTQARAVVISTPNHLHKEIAAKFMSVGIEVICDKPLATSLKDALELVELQRKTGLVFGVTYAFSCHPIVRQAREMVRNGSLGRIRQSGLSAA